MVRSSRVGSAALRSRLGSAASSIKRSAARSLRSAMSAVEGLPHPAHKVVTFCCCPVRWIWHLVSFKFHYQRFFGLDMLAPVELAMVVGAVLEACTDGPEVHVYFVRFLRPGHHSLELSGRYGVINFLLFGFMFYLLLLNLAMALGDKTNFIQLFFAFIGAFGNLGFGRGLIIAGKEADPFYYDRRQRLGNVQVGAYMVTLGIIFAFEFFCRLFLFVRKFWRGERQVRLKRILYADMLIVLAQLGVQLGMFVLYLFFIISVHKPMRLPQWQTFSGYLIDGEPKDGILEWSKDIFLNALRQLTTDFAVWTPPLMLSAIYIGTLLDDNYFMLVFLSSLAFSLSSGVLSIIWLYSTNPVVDPMVGGIFQQLHIEELYTFGFYCLGASVFHLLTIVAHCHFTPRWALMADISGIGTMAKQKREYKRERRAELLMSGDRKQRRTRRLGYRTGLGKALKKKKGGTSKSRVASETQPRPMKPAPPSPTTPTTPTSPPTPKSTSTSPQGREVGIQSKRILGGRRAHN